MILKRTVRVVWPLCPTSGGRFADRSQCAGLELEAVQRPAACQHTGKLAAERLRCPPVDHRMFIGSACCGAAERMVSS